MKKIEKLEFDIVKADFKDQEILEMVQKCFTLAQLSLVTQSSKICFRNYLLRTKNLIKSFIYVFVSALFYNYFIGINLYYNLFIISGIYLFVYFLIIRENLRKGLKEYVDQVKSKKDLSTSKVNTIYSSKKNLFLIAKTRKNEIIGTGAILIGDEKNIYREDFGQVFDENDSLLLRVSVLPKYHGNGIGKALYQACFDFAKKNNSRSINLFVRSTQITAINLYKSLKFKTVASIDLEPDYDLKAFQMKLNI